MHDAAPMAAAETTRTGTCCHMDAKELTMKHTGCPVCPVLPDNGLVLFPVASRHLRLFVRGAGSRISTQWGCFESARGLHHSRQQRNSLQSSSSVWRYLYEY